MKILWNAAEELRAFYALWNKQFTLRSRRVVDSGGAINLENLIIVYDENCVFLDLEFDTTVGVTLDPLPLPERSCRATGMLTSKVAPQVTAIQWWFEEEKDVDVMVLAFRQPTGHLGWVQLGWNPVYIGLDDAGYLSVIACTEVFRDPEGRVENDWVGAIEE